MSLEPFSIAAAVVLAVALAVWRLCRLRGYWQRREIGSPSPLLTRLWHRFLPHVTLPRLVMTWPSQQSWWVSGIGAIACLLTLAGQWQLVQSSPDLVTGYSSLIGGAVLFLLALRIQPAVDRESDRADGLLSAEPALLFPSTPLRLVLIGFGLGLGFFNARLIDQHKEGDSYWGAFALWIASLALYLLAFFPASRRAGMNRQRASRMFYFLAGAIALVAFGARFYGLGRVPWVMVNDEADVGMQVVAVLQGQRTNMFVTHSSFGTLEFFAMALPVQVLGTTKYALRWLSAVGGWMAIPVTVVLAKRMFGNRIALVSAALLAVSHLSIHFSHVSTAASTFDPLLAALGLYLVYRAWQTRVLFTWALAGLALSMTMYGYAGARAILIVAILFLAALAVVKRSALSNWSGGVVLAVSSLLGMAPMLLWIVRNPDLYNYRLNQVSIFQSRWLMNEALARNVPAWQILLEQLRDALLNFNFYEAGAFYDAGVPMLGPVTAALFVLGLAYTLTRWRDERFLLLNLWFWIPLLAGQVLMTLTARSAYRTLSLLPCVCIMAAIALVKLADLILAWVKRRPGWVVVALVAALVLEGGWNLYFYFRVWAPGYQYSDWVTRAASLMADYVHDLGPGYQVFVLGTQDFSESWAVFNFLTPGQSYVGVPGDVSAVSPMLRPDSRAVFFFHPERVGELPTVASAIPGGRRKEYYWGDTLYFVVYQAPGRLVLSP